MCFILSIYFIIQQSSNSQFFPFLILHSLVGSLFFYTSYTPWKLLILENLEVLHGTSISKQPLKIVGKDATFLLKAQGYGK